MIHSSFSVFTKAVSPKAYLNPGWGIVITVIKMQNGVAGENKGISTRIATLPVIVVVF